MNKSLALKITSGAFIGLAALSATGTLIAFAQGGGGTITGTPTQSNAGGSQTISLPNPLGSIKTIPELIGRLVDWLIYIASIAILPGMIIWGAYQLLMAGGNPDKVTEGRHTITWAIVGYALLLISRGIEFIIRDILTGSVS